MKKPSILIVFLFFGISILAKENLIAVSGDIKTTDLYIIEEAAPQTYIALATDQEIEQLKKQKITLEILDKAPLGKDYYFVWPVAETRERVAKVGTILAEYTGMDVQREFHRCYLVHVPKENEDALFKLRAEKNYLEFDRAVFKDAPPIGFKGYDPKTWTYNQLIQDMVDAVSVDTLRKMVLHMQNIQSRHASYSFNRDEMVPWFCGLLREYGCDSVFAQNIGSSSYNAPNPVGIRLGKKYPSYTRYFLVGGHPDAMPRRSTNYGADDNATGATMVLEAARVMQNYNFEHTIVYMGFNAEEVGLLGSAHWAKKAEQRGDTILGVISYDMAGHTNNYEQFRIRYYSGLPGCYELAQVFDRATSTYTKLDLVVSKMDQINGWSDHASFWRKGFVAAYGMEREMSSGVYHTLGDTVDAPGGLNNFPFFTNTVRAAVATTAVKECAAVMDQVGGIVRHPIKKAVASITTQVFSRNSITIFLTGNINPHTLSLRIVNVSGKHIKTIPLRNERSSIQTVTWDGTDTTQRRVASGLYFVELNYEGLKLVEKIMLN